MPGAVDQEDQRVISGQDIDDPTRLESLHVLERGREPQPCYDRKDHVDHAPGQEIPGIAEQPFEDRNRLGRPSKQRGEMQRNLRAPVAALVAFARKRSLHPSSPYLPAALPSFERPLQLGSSRPGVLAKSYCPGPIRKAGT